MPKVVSRWRAASRRVIDGVLGDLTLPEKADAARVRALLRAAYPFGERKFLPYKMWLEEVRRALRRLGLAPLTTATAPGVDYVLIGGEPEVKCLWRRGCPGCLACRLYQDERVRLLLLPDWPGWAASLREGDPTTPLVLADRLGELGLVRLETFFRALGVKE